MSEAHDLERFLTGQEGRIGERSAYETALSELKQGEKANHWIWFIFPQILGLGDSVISQRYGIKSLDEAYDFLKHPVLGPRFNACLEAVDPHAGKSAVQVFGARDAEKFRSCLTLFAEAGSPLSRSMLGRWFYGEPDELTLELINGH